jgi:hypothetical protein
MTVTLTRPDHRRATAKDPACEETTRLDAAIPVALKTPLAPRALIASLDRKLTLAQAVREVRQMRSASAADSRLIEQLSREIAGQHDFLAIGPGGELTKVDPEKTTLGDICVPREVRTPRGVETAQIAGFEVQAYAPVGIGRR